MFKARLCRMAKKEGFETPQDMICTYVQWGYSMEAFIRHLEYYHKYFISHSGCYAVTKKYFARARRDRYIVAIRTKRITFGGDGPIPTVRSLKKYKGKAFMNQKMRAMRDARARSRGFHNYTTAVAALTRRGWSKHKIEKEFRH